MKVFGYLLGTILLIVCTLVLGQYLFEFVNELVGIVFYSLIFSTIVTYAYNKINEHKAE